MVFTTLGDFKESVNSVYFENNPVVLLGENRCLKYLLNISTQKYINLKLEN